jgi:hypothetical protein
LYPEAPIEIRELDGYDDQSILPAPAFLTLSRARAILNLAHRGSIETDGSDDQRILDGLIAVGFGLRDGGAYSYACDDATECAEQKF